MASALGVLLGKHSTLVVPLVADWHCLAHARTCKRHLVAMQAQAIYKRIHSDQMTGRIIRDLEILGLVDPLRKKTINNVVEAQSYIHEASFQKGTSEQWMQCR